MASRYCKKYAKRNAVITAGYYMPNIAAVLSKRTTDQSFYTITTSFDGINKSPVSKNVPIVVSCCHWSCLSQII